MPERRREVGFLSALGDSSLASLVWPEGAAALVIGFGGASLLVAESDVPARINVAGDSLVVLAPLLGVVLAALTLVIAVSSEEYTRALNETSKGVVGFYRPFIIAIGLEVWTILLAIAYRATAANLDSVVEGWLFRLLGFLIAFCVLDILAIGRNVLMHAVTRARMT